MRFPPRLRQAGHQPVPHGIGTNRHDDGDRAGRVLGHLGGGARPRHDEVHAQACQVGGEVQEPVALVLVPANVEGDRLPFDIAQVPQSLSKAIQPSARFPGRDTRHEHANARHLPRWLGLGGERRHEQTQDEREEAPDSAAPHSHFLTSASCRPNFEAERQAPRVLCACPRCASHAYWITSSARRSRDGGIVSPSALAVLRLMISSNFVGCSTGKSAGLAPLRILST